MRPLNFAILKYYAQGVEASRADVQKALEADYGNFRAFKDKAMDEALMTAASNGLLEESRLDLDENGNLVIYYKALEDGIAAINNYIKD
ncbi:MAG: hypothetical protein ACOYJU_06360 [Anaerovoracaceae bacterium]|jgi:DNA-binding PadR family transcriptional regulator